MLLFIYFQFNKRWMQVTFGWPFTDFHQIIFICPWKFYFTMKKLATAFHNESFESNECFSAWKLKTWAVKLNHTVSRRIWNYLLLTDKYQFCIWYWLYTFLLVFQGMYVFLHAVKGTPFETPDQGRARLLTHWEQLDYGVQFTSSRKFFTISPIIL